MRDVAERRTALAVLVVMLLGIAWLTLRPMPWSAGSSPSTCVLCGQRGAVDLILNIVLFFPLGLAVGRLGGRIGSRPLLVAGAALLFSLAIEFAQIVIPGRAPTWRDVVMNAIGAGLGAWVAHDLHRWTHHRRAGLCAWLAGAAAVVAVWLSGWAMQPAVAEHEWYGQLAPKLDHLAEWDGAVDSVRIGDMPVVHGPMREPSVAHRLVEARSAITIDATMGRKPAELAPLFAITDDEYEEMLLIGQQGDDLVLRERRRASDLRLLEPEFRLPRFFISIDSGRPFRLEVRSGTTDACAFLDAAPLVCAPSLPSSSAWMLLLYRSRFGDGTRALLGAITFACFFLPLGLFAGAGRPRFAIGLAILCAAGVHLAALATGLALPTVIEWAAALTGVATGYLFSRSRAPRSTPA